MSRLPCAVFARTVTAEVELGRQFRRHRVIRRYLARGLTVYGTVSFAISGSVHRRLLPYIVACPAEPANHFEPGQTRAGTTRSRQGRNGAKANGNTQSVGL